MPSMTEYLVSQGILPLEALDSNSSNPADDERTMQTLLEIGFITNVQFAQAGAAKAQLPFVELFDYSIDLSAVNKLDSAYCRKHHVLAIAIKDNRLVLAMDDPDNVVIMDDVASVTGMAVDAVVAESSDLLAVTNRVMRFDTQIDDLSNAFHESAPPIFKERQFGHAITEDSAGLAPIVRFVNLLISQAIHDRASDIHIEPREQDLLVRYRIDGVLHQAQVAPKRIQNGVISRIKIMSEIDIAEHRKPQDGRMSVNNDGRRIDLRVATLPTIWGEKLVLRILDNASTRTDVSELDLSEKNLATFRTSFSKPHGMILITGPTGSGKSTTLYTTLGTIARPDVNVITVEDPVEIRMAGINQIQVNSKAGLTFASALRAILRSDPDIVLIGEIRDHETAQIAIDAALTGHLVLSTLHTNDAPSAITRLTEMGIEPFLVALALDSVMAQRLARRLCDRCKKPAQYGADFLTNLHFAFDLSRPIPTIYQPVGCISCTNTGYRGRIAIQEIMTVTEEIEMLTVAKASGGEISRKAREQGMRTMREDGWTKVMQGLTSVEEILRVVA